jgi:hypothetical protein
MIHEVLKELGPKNLNRIYGQSSHRYQHSHYFISATHEALATVEKQMYGSGTDDRRARASDIM